MNEEMRGKDGEFQMSVDGDSLSNLNQDQVNQIVESVNQSIEKAIAAVNENLANLFGGQNINKLKKENSQIDLSQVISGLSSSNLLSKLASSSWKGKMPVIKTDNGKLSVLLNEKKLFEMDLPNQENKE
ncbi:hypothetical protein B5V88_13490 [Heyndrickxia sporothermodurans]|uniref:Uncharacterized protein n=1 Tax=Heyndrickxia sporothermodurans TaxID=46224 RepID=A0AB37HFY1_9BACI|nr:hypothetical protein [Heyndrickxia sporothermodurans]MBL5766825.1 hypothetical protein [Heyndrickxia sporothermodurans]MBL5771391.1 hypothetical protein [Heyndrickxia sporothermodurans]MBL5774135.1 hypothetical protein [Heyndrickxia sporothermodurans]MBL5777552.1 hypothetical protein [Heyndrickxia sporothermodurans]MBL5781059.1 hypothetical protein [Heyndrickxia sporothermodurans]